MKGVPTQKILKIKNINKGVMFLEDGSLAKILAIDGINLSLKSEEEKQVIASQFQSFLNSFAKVPNHIGLITILSGVEIRKAVVAPLLAPCFFKEAAAGSTLHEHKGMGMPSNAALNTELKRPLPRCRTTNSVDKNILKIPPTAIPKRI